MMTRHPKEMTSVYESVPAANWEMYLTMSKSSSYLYPGLVVLLALSLLFCGYQLTALRVSPEVTLSIAESLPVVENVQREDTNGNFIVYYTSEGQPGEFILSMDKVVEQPDRKAPELFIAPRSQLILAVPPQHSWNGMELLQVENLNEYTTLERRRFLVGACNLVSVILYIGALVLIYKMNRARQRK